MSTITMLAANIQNLGGVSKILHGTLDIMKVPLAAMKTGLQNLIAPMIAKITTTYAMTAAESRHAAALWAAVAPLLPFVAIGILVISVIKEIANNWGSVTAAFELGGILGAIKQIGALLISGLLASVQGLLELLSNIPGLGSLAGKGAGKIEEFRNFLTGEGDTVKQTTEMGAAASGTIGTSTLQSDIAGLRSQIGVTLTPELGPAITVPNFANTGTAIEIPAQHIAPQAVTTTASSSGNSLAMEHIEAARRKGVAASDISYTAASAFENAGAYTRRLWLLRPSRL
jgi:hypothetical protein